MMLFSLVVLDQEQQIPHQVRNGYDAELGAYWRQVHTKLLIE
jgi:hypothetical protein